VGKLNVLVCAAANAGRAAAVAGVAAAVKGAPARQLAPELPAATQPAAKVAPPTQPPTADYPTFCLRIPGQRTPLAIGLKLKTSDMVGLETKASDGTVAEVVPNPNESGSLGLKNLSTRAWKATLASDEEKDVPPGRSIRLAVGTRIHFGVFEAVIE
jgi:hypothetical protein